METLEQFSTMALYSAMIVYSIAFVFYVVDLANRSASTNKSPLPTRSRAANIGISLTILGGLLHLGVSSVVFGGGFSSGFGLIRESESLPDRWPRTRQG